MVGPGVLCCVGFLTFVGVCDGPGTCVSVVMTWGQVGLNLLSIGSVQILGSGSWVLVPGILAFRDWCQGILGTVPESWYLGSLGFFGVLRSSCAYVFVSIYVYSEKKKGNIFT